MTEYIDREALLADIDAAMENEGMGYVVGQTLKRYVKRAPAADVAPVRHGRWENGFIDTGDGPMPERAYLCSQCGKAQWRKSRYCPNCGAKMDG